MLKTFNFTLFIFFFYSNALYSQKIDYTKAYYPHIMLAKKEIMNENYLKALTHYEDAFKNVHTSFALDYYNALVCALKLNNYDKSIIYVDTLISMKGVEISKIEKYLNVDFKSFFATKQWEEINLEYSLKRTKYLSKVNFKLLEIARTLDYKDQKVRQNYNRSPEKLKSISETDSLNVLELKNFLIQHNFPTNEQLNTGFGKVPYHIVLLHHAQYMPSYRNDFEILLKKAVIDGKFPIDDFIDFQDASLGEPFVRKEHEKTDYGSRNIVGVKNEESGKYDYYFPKKYVEKKESIDKKRKEMGLMNLDDSFRYFLFSLNEKSRIFALGISYNHINGIKLNPAYFINLKEYIQNTLDKD